MGQDIPSKRFQFYFSLEDRDFKHWLYEGVKASGLALQDAEGNLTLRHRALYELVRDGSFHGACLEQAQKDFLLTLFSGRTLVFNKSGEITHGLNPQKKHPSFKAHQRAGFFFHALQREFISGDNSTWGRAKKFFSSRMADQGTDDAALEKLLSEIPSAEDMRFFMQAVELNFRAQGKKFFEILEEEVSGRLLGRCHALVETILRGEEAYLAKTYSLGTGRNNGLGELFTRLKKNADGAQNQKDPPGSDSPPLTKAQQKELKEKAIALATELKNQSLEVLRPVADRFGLLPTTLEKAAPLALGALVAARHVEIAYSTCLAEGRTQENFERESYATWLLIDRQKAEALDAAFAAFQTELRKYCEQIQYADPVKHPVTIHDIDRLNHAMMALYRQIDIFRAGEESARDSLVSRFEAAEAASYQAIGALASIYTGGLATGILNGVFLGVTAGTAVETATRLTGDKLHGREINRHRVSEAIEEARDNAVMSSVGLGVGRTAGMVGLSGLWRAALTNVTIGEANQGLTWGEDYGFDNRALNFLFGCLSGKMERLIGHRALTHKIGEMFQETLENLAECQMKTGTITVEDFLHSLSGAITEMGGVEGRKHPQGTKPSDLLKDYVMHRAKAPDSAPPTQEEAIRLVLLGQVENATLEQKINDVNSTRIQKANFPTLEEIVVGGASLDTLSHSFEFDKAGIPVRQSLTDVFHVSSQEKGAFLEQVQNLVRQRYFDMARNMEARLEIQGLSQEQLDEALFSKLGEASKGDVDSFHQGVKLLNRKVRLVEKIRRLQEILVHHPEIHGRSLIDRLAALLQQIIGMDALSVHTHLQELDSLLELAPTSFRYSDLNLGRRYEGADVMGLAEFYAPNLYVAGNVRKILGRYGDIPATLAKLIQQGNHQVVFEFEIWQERQVLISDPEIGLQLLIGINTETHKVEFMAIRDYSQELSGTFFRLPEIFSRPLTETYSRFEAAQSDGTSARISGNYCAYSSSAAYDSSRNIMESMIGNNTLLRHLFLVTRQYFSQLESAHIWHLTEIGPYQPHYNFRQHRMVAGVGEAETFTHEYVHFIYAMMKEVDRLKIDSHFRMNHEHFMQIIKQLPEYQRPEHWTNEAFAYHLSAIVCRRTKTLLGSEVSLEDVKLLTELGYLPKPPFSFEGLKNVQDYYDQLNLSLEAGSLSTETLEKQSLQEKIGAVQIKLKKYVNLEPQSVQAQQYRRLQSEHGDLASKTLQQLIALYKSYQTLQHNFFETVAERSSFPRFIPTTTTM